MRNEGKVLLASLLWSIFVPIAVADEWKITGALDQSVEYDDNIDMKVEPTPVFGYLMHPSFGVEWNTAVIKLGMTGRGDIRRYDDKQWDCDTFSLGMDQQYLQKTSVFSVTGNYSRSCSYTDQLSDTGVIEPDNESETYSLSPSWSWQWSALDRISISPSYSQTVYSSTGTINSNFQDNKTYSLNISESHSWTRRLNSSASFFVSRSEFGSSENISIQNSFGFQISTDYNITRMWTANIGGGLNWVKSPSNSNVFTNSNDDELLRTELFNFGLNYSGRRMNYAIDYSRSNRPSASGQITEYNEVNVNYSYEISREWSFNVDASMNKNQSIGQSVFQISSDRTYYTASVGVTWDFDKEWRISTSYRYRHQQFTSSGVAQIINGQERISDSNTLMVNLNYNWDGLRIFR